MPDEDRVHALELGFDVIHEVVLVDGGLGAHSGGIERSEQRREAARGRVSAISCQSIAGIQDGHA
jgi:hypothetical protein